jgi:hypothetical protein
MKLNLPFTRNYKGTEIEIVVEDDVITTAKIFKDGECVACDDTLADENGKDLPFNRKNYYAVLKVVMDCVDKNYAVEVATSAR